MQTAQSTTRIMRDVVIALMPALVVSTMVFGLDVLLELCDRILVLCGGKVSGIVDGRTTTKEEVGLLMTRVGGKEKAAHE